MEIGDKVAYVKWENKYMDSWEYDPVGNAPQFNYDVRRSYQKIIAWGGLCGNGFILGHFF